MEFEFNPVAIWSLTIGLVFLIAAFGKGPLRRWPISMPTLYLGVGVAIGPWGLNLLHLDLIKDAKTIEIITEIAVLISLLTAGLQLAPSLTLLQRAPIPLATVTMVITIACLAALGYFLLALPIGASILLGAVLAPTDPVLANEVQVRHHHDTDRLRYALTGEAGLNDGAAFPFIMLGLGLMGVHEIGAWGWRWIFVDLLWASFAGLGIGWLVGYAVSRVATKFKQSKRVPPACEELLTLGLIGLSYGAAMQLQTYGFLSVFASGVAMRWHAGNESQDDGAEMTMKTVTAINEQFGQIIEVAAVVLIGTLLVDYGSFRWDWWISLSLFVLLRPLATFIGLANSAVSTEQKSYIAFFGIRGIGSLYYLAYAINHGLDEATSQRLGELVLTTVTFSMLFHCNSASLLLRYYSKEE